MPKPDQGSLPLITERQQYFSIGVACGVLLVSGVTVFIRVAFGVWPYAS